MESNHDCTIQILWYQKLILGVEMTKFSSNCTQIQPFWVDSNSRISGEGAKSSKKVSHVCPLVLQYQPEPFRMGTKKSLCFFPFLQPQTSKQRLFREQSRTGLVPRILHDCNTTKIDLVHPLLNNFL